MDYERKVWEDGGFSVDKDGNSPTSGYMVSMPGRERKYPASEFGNNVVEEYLSGNLDQLHRTDVHTYLGGWLDGDTVYLDISRNMDTLAEAVSMGYEWSQKAIYDVAKGESIYLW